MKRLEWIVPGVIVLGMTVGAGHVFAQRDEMPVGYPQSLEPSLQVLLRRLHEGSPSPSLLVQVASTYFDLADDLLVDEKRRRAAYEAGAKAAEQAFQLDDSNADAHFFHAANLGSGERLRGIANAALVVKEIRIAPCARLNSTPAMPKRSR